MNAMSSSLLTRDFIENGYDPYRMLNTRQQRPISSVPPMGPPSDMLGVTLNDLSSSSCFSQQPNVTPFSSFAPNLLLNRNPTSEAPHPWLIPNSGFPSIPKMSNSVRVSSVGSGDELAPKVEPSVKTDVLAQQSQLLSFLAGQNAASKIFLGNSQRNSTPAPGLLTQGYYSDPRSSDGNNNNNNLRSFPDFSRYIAQHQQRQSMASVGEVAQFGSNSPMQWNSLNQTTGNQGRFGYSQCSNSRHVPLSFGPSSLSFDASSDVDFLNMLADVDKQFSQQVANGPALQSTNFASTCCNSLNRDNDEHPPAGIVNNNRKSMEINVSNTNSQKHYNTNYNINDGIADNATDRNSLPLTPSSKDWIEGMSQFNCRVDLSHKPPDLSRPVQELVKSNMDLVHSINNLKAKCDQPHRTAQSAETTSSFEPCCDDFSKPFNKKKNENRRKRKPKLSNTQSWPVDQNQKRKLQQASEDIASNAVYISTQQLPSRRGAGILESM